MSVLLPDPETPVTHTNIPRGISTSISLRLFSRAPFTTSHCSPQSLRLVGMSITFLPDKYWPVREADDFMIFWGDPNAITFPPSAPAPGPRSTM